MLSLSSLQSFLSTGHQRVAYPEHAVSGLPTTVTPVLAVVHSDLCPTRQSYGGRYRVAYLRASGIRRCFLEYSYPSDNEISRPCVCPVCSPASFIAAPASGRYTLSAEAQLHHYASIRNSQDSQSTSSSSKKASTPTVLRQTVFTAFVIPNRGAAPIT
jgi:hypothetical protein